MEFFPDQQSVVMETLWAELRVAFISSVSLSQECFMAKVSVGRLGILNYENMMK